MKLQQTLVGDTPMIQIRYRFRGNEGSIFAKMEFYNPSGSIKDRIAYYILDKAEKDGTLKPGQPIVEVTSGNTGIAFAALGALKKHPVHIFMPDWASEERKSIMRMYGAELHLVSKEEGGFCGALEQSWNVAKELGAFQPRQFENADNPAAHYYGTGEEILRQAPGVTDFVAGVGSGGTLMGVSKRLKEDHPVRATALEPDAVPLLSGGTIKGGHKIEGIGDDFIPAIVDKKLIDNVVVVNDIDSIIMANMLARELGMGVGISSGANFLGAVLQNQEPGRTVVTVFADDNKKYLTTQLSNPPQATPDMLSSQIELINYTCAECPYADSCERKR